MIVIDGDPPLPGWKQLVAPDAAVIAADGGARHARNEAVDVRDLVGDFDTLSDREVDDFARQGARIHRFAAEKDSTDFELAACLARSDWSASTDDVLVVGGAGGRLDHALGNLVVLGGGELAPFAVTALVGHDVVRVATAPHPVTIDGPVGGTVSLIPVHGTAHGVVTSGLRYALDREDLHRGASRGISNLLESAPATVTVDDGTVLVIEPGAVDHLIAQSRGEAT